MSLIVFGFIVFNSGEGNALKQNTGQVVVERHALFPDFSTDIVMKKARLIIMGKPVKVISTFSEGENNPITEFQFKIDEVYKGKSSLLKDGYITVFQDGVYGDDYDTHPIMQINEEYVLFLEEPVKDKFIMVGGPSGKFEYNETKKTFVSSTNKEVRKTELASLSMNEE